MINGLIIVNKEKGFTSHDVVAKLRGIFQQKKIGHTGTLDPDATGVLAICLGNATKISDMLTEKTKEYRATLLLGKTSDTQDIWGTILSNQECKVGENEVLRVFDEYRGETKQIPPMYSALKVDGHKLVDLARQGKEVIRKSREITIFELEIEKIDLPSVTFRVVCSKGTYIRTLCNDIGEKLGCGGLLSALERIRVGKFSIDMAHSLAEIETAKKQESVTEFIFPTDSMFANIRAIRVTEEGRKWIDNGNSLLTQQVSEQVDLVDKECFRVYNDEGRFCAVYEYNENRKMFTPLKMFM